MKIAFDDNLGLPDDFASRLQCELMSFHELDAMLAAFSDGSVHGMFAPCGALPYMQAYYEILAQATFGETRGLRLQSRFVVPDNDGVRAEFPNGRVACVNRFCTTSYWAPMLAMIDRTAGGTPVQFYAAAGFDDMLFAVTDGRSDGAMVWDAVLNRHPDAAAKTREVFRYDGLPTPVILANSSMPEQDKDRLRESLHSYVSASGGFFNGFSAPDVDAVQAFVTRDRQAQQHYALAPLQHLGAGII